MVAGLTFNIGTEVLINLRLDDAVDAIPVHLFGGIWGLISLVSLLLPLNYLMSTGETSILACSTHGTNADQTARYLGHKSCGYPLFCAVMFPLFVWFDWKGWFRSGALEVVGLDTSYHYGNMALINGETDHDVNPDYIAAYQKKPQYYLRRRAAVPNASGHTISESRAETLSGDSLGKSV
jgi:hypothetical protein